MKTRVHVTDRTVFKECRRKYRYACVEHLVHQSVSKVGSALWIGTTIHKALADWYGYRALSPLEAWRANIKEVRLLDVETTLLCETMLARYTSFAFDADRLWQVCGVEEEIEIRVPHTRVYLVGTLDLLIKEFNHSWIVDHKTRSRLPEEKELEVDDQMTAYLWLLRQSTGITAAGAIYNILRKKVPTEPRLLANGQLSKDISIDTTFDIYRAAIIKNGLHEHDYVDFLDKLQKKPNTFFYRIIVTRNSYELDAFANQLTQEVREMTSKQTTFYPSPGRQCGYCDYVTLCKAQNEGSDVDYLKKSCFVVSEER